MNWERTALVAAGVAAAHALTGCSDDGSQITGELGNGTFYYACDSSIATCDGAGHASQVPAAVATGAKFRIDFQRSGNKADIDTVVPIAKAIIDVAPDGLFTANREGWGGFTAIDPSTKLVDFSEVRIVKPAAVWLNAHSEDALTMDQNNFQTLTITTGGIAQSTYTLTANLHSETNELLAGELTFEWKVADPTIVTITNPQGHTATITGVKTGTTSFTVSGAGVTKTVSVEVQ